MIEFAIDIKGDHAKKIKKEVGKPGQEVFYLNYLNLCQYLRKRELKTEVDVGDHEFHKAELEQKLKEEQEQREKEEKEQKEREEKEQKEREEAERKLKAEQEKKEKEE
jgi:hypothetical protein